MAKKENHWETVHIQEGENTKRMPVPGGWIYRTVMIPWSENEPTTFAMVFVPDPKANT